MNFPGDCGCEFYEGDGDVIGAAIMASDWEALRNGTAARSYVSFPTFIIGSYVVEFERAVASVLRKPQLNIHEERMVAGEDGHWSADVWLAYWVEAVASLTEENIPEVIRLWKEECVHEYDEVDDWDERVLSDALSRLIILCREALARKSEVVFLFL